MRTLRVESEALANRVVRCLPGATFEMETFVRLAGIEATREIPTAAVTCAGRPRLLINPDFVAEYCARDEHLFLLVMHELRHVMLAHSTVYPRWTLVQNIALDAVINADLCERFKAVEYRGFFEALNPADRFPGLLLRPPVGWPSAPRYGIASAPMGAMSILERLYPPPGVRRPEFPLYAEIVAVLERARHGEKAGESAVVLLGDHGDPGFERRVAQDEQFEKALRRIAAELPELPGVRRAGAGREQLAEIALRSEEPMRAVRHKFASVLRGALQLGAGRARTRSWRLESRTGGPAPIPNARDRLSAARRALGLTHLLHAQEVVRGTIALDAPSIANVYWDVSGSMFPLLPHLLGLLRPHVAARRARLFQFSTVVVPLPPDPLRAGRLATTGGTQIDCVFEHAVADRRLRRILLLTDGYVGSPSREHVAALRARRLEVHVVLPAESAQPDYLSEVAHTITVLPPLRE